MNYELAKQLQDAGFKYDWVTVLSSKKIQARNIKLDEPIMCKIPMEVDEEFKSHPTLEELIEACGDNFTNLAKGVYKGQNGYIAYKGIWNGVTTEIPSRVGFGEKPSIAVAKLWLELNK